jgi:hypothetical protein
MKRQIELLKRALIALENSKQFIADWGTYADDYSKKKYDLDGDISAHDILMMNIKDEIDDYEKTN